MIDGDVDTSMRVAAFGHVRSVQAVTRVNTEQASAYSRSLRGIASKIMIGK
jgi:hypothetical protein